MSGGGGHKRRGGHDEEHEEHENHERWLVSYADMMTLLMVLFIVLFAISQVDSKKFMALKTGLSAGFGAPVAMLTGADQLLQPGGAVAPDSVNLAGAAKGESRSFDPKTANQPMTTEDIKKITDLVRSTTRAANTKEAEKLLKAEKDLQKALVEAGIPKSATFRFDERGLIVTIATDQVLFESGSATLRWKGQEILDALIPTLVKLPNEISIDGHTDSTPINTAQFPSNWELSAARATGVLQYVARKGIPVDRLRATGFADTRPLVSGTSAAALQSNRRVEIVVLAAIDNGAGRAIAEIANGTPDPAAGLMPSPTPSAEPSAEPSSEPSAGASSEPSATPHASTAPTPHPTASRKAGTSRTSSTPSRKPTH